MPVLRTGHALSACADALSACRCGRVISLRNMFPLAGFGNQPIHEEDRKRLRERPRSPPKTDTETHTEPNGAAGFVLWPQLRKPSSCQTESTDLLTVQALTEELEKANKVRQPIFACLAPGGSRQVIISDNYRIARGVARGRAASRE